MLTPEQVAKFKTDGFLNFGPVLTEAQRSDLKQALDRVLEGKSDAAPELNRNLAGGNDVVIQIVNIWQAEPAFRRHLYNPAIVGMVSQLMGCDTVRVWHDQIQIKPARVGGPTVWHQDHPYWPVIHPPDLVSAWVAIEDAVQENGCMSMVRHSQSWGPYKDGTIGNRPDHSPDFDPSLIPQETVEVVPIPVPAGGVAFHHCLTWHGAPPNRSDRPRPAIAVHYMPGYTRYEPAGKTHAVEHHITVAPGEILQGEYFPTVMESGRILQP